MIAVTNKSELEAAVLKISERAKSGDGERLCLFKMGKAFIAVGDSADALYRRFGWELSEIQKPDDSGTAVYILLNTSGIDFLKSRFSLHLLNTEYTYRIERLSVVEIQEFLDWSRGTLGKTDGVFYYPMVKKEVEFVDDGMATLHRLSSIYITPISAGVELDGYNMHSLASKTEWNFDERSIAILKALSGVLAEQGKRIELCVSDPINAAKTQKKGNTKVYNMYQRAKRSFGSGVVLVKEKSHFVTFDDDAIITADKLSLLLYDCPIDGPRSHTAACLDAEEYYRLAEQDVDILVTNGDKREYYDFGFCESILNDVMNKEPFLTDGRLYKLQNGTYVVGAKYDNYELEEQPVSNRYGIYYQSLPAASLEKVLLLKALLYNSYREYLSND